MLIDYQNKFLKTLSKIKDKVLKERIKKQIEKIINNPEIGKPMMYSRKGTRELYISPYRIAYAYFVPKEKLIFLELYHKDKQ